MAEKQDFSREIMTKIKEDKIKMKPRVYFMLASVLLVFSFVLVILLTVFFVNLVAFRLRVHGPFNYLVFGTLGIGPFFQSFPWIFLGTTLLGIGLVVYLMKKFDFSYHHNFILLTISSVISIIVIGGVIDLIGVNEKMVEFSPFELLFEEPFQQDNWVIGEIIGLDQNYLLLLQPDGEVVQITWNEETLLPFGANFQAGERIRIVGEWQGEVFVAKAIGKGGLNWRESMPSPSGDVNGIFRDCPKGRSCPIQ